MPLSLYICMKNSGWNSTTKDRLIKKNSLIKIKKFFPFKQAFKQINTRLYEKTLVRKTLAQGGGLREKQLIKTWSVQRHAFNAGAASSRALSVQRWTGGKQEHSLIEKMSLFPVPAHHYGYTKDSRLSAALETPPGTVPLLSEDWSARSSSWVLTKLRMAL